VDDLKVAVKANILDVLRNRTGKTKLVRNRFFGLAKKVLVRNAKRCPISETQARVALQAFESANGIQSLTDALLFVLDERTKIKCPKINVNLKRKVKKIAVKARNQTFSK
jgi:hypothetical protein